MDCKEGFPNGRIMLCVCNQESITQNIYIYIYIFFFFFLKENVLVVLGCNKMCESVSDRTEVTSQTDLF